MVPIENTNLIIQKGGNRFGSKALGGEARGVGLGSFVGRSDSCTRRDNFGSARVY